VQGFRCFMMLLSIVMQSLAVRIWYLLTQTAEACSGSPKCVGIDQVGKRRVLGGSFSFPWGLRPGGCHLPAERFR
jgi:hypothetical protein